MNDAEKNNLREIDDLIEKYALDQEDRCGVLLYKNIGDNYFFISSLEYLQKILNRRLIIIVEANSSLEAIIAAFTRGGADIEYINASKDLCNLANNASQELMELYKGKVEFNFIHQILKKYYKYSAPLSLRRHLSRPKYPSYDRQEIINKYGIITGKSIFMHTVGTWASTPDSGYWKIICNILAALGFKIFINSPTDLGYGPDISYISPPIEELVAIADVCGYFFGLRSGLTELIALESNAHLTVLNISSEPDYIRIWYPFVPPGKIQYLTTGKRRGCGFPAIDARFEEACAHILYPFNGHECNTSLKSIKWIKADANYGVRAFTDLPFSCHASNFDSDTFQSIYYSLDVSSNYILLYLKIDPSLFYEIHVGLLTLNSNEYVSTVSCSHNNPIAIPVYCSGKYKIFVKIYHPSKDTYAFFTTREFKATVICNEALLASIYNYDTYIKTLAEYRERLIIFITSRDAHTPFANRNQLNLDQLGLSAGIEELFRYSWLAIIDGGTVITEQSHPQKEVTFEYEFDGNVSRLSSSGYNVNHNDKTPISISINGEEQAMNKRGLNFVIWDKCQRKVIDSVTFDTYSPMRPATREIPLYNQEF